MEFGEGTKEPTWLMPPPPFYRPFFWRMGSTITFTLNWSDYRRAKVLFSRFQTSLLFIAGPKITRNHTTGNLRVKRIPKDNRKEEVSFYTPCRGGKTTLVAPDRLREGRLDKSKGGKTRSPA
jgi:hypothetical protein